jgi:predicted pyridoxine 5'-phosphate oxidase superfamily flavin-nucleotide-binding protein
MNPLQNRDHRSAFAAIALFLLLSLGALAMVIADQPGEDTGSGGTPGMDNALDCPRGTPEGFSLSDVEGKTLPELERWAEQRDMTVRTTLVDGKPKAMTMDYRFNRINVQVEAGVVTRYCGNG